MAIFCRTVSVTCRVARHATMCGWTPVSMSRLMPSCAALDFCSPRISGSMMYVRATKQVDPGPSSKASSRNASM
jgi:hypothetical protein